MTKINSNPPQNFHYIFLMHRFMIFKRSVQYANFFLSVYMLLFPDFTTLVCCFFPFTSPHPMKCRNRLIAKYAKMLLYTVLVFEEWVWLGDTSPCLRGEWLSVWTGGGGSRDGRQNRAQPFALHVFPCTIQALCFCWKTLFSLSFCLVKQPSLNFSVSSSTNKGSEVTASFWGGRLSYCQICLSIRSLWFAGARIKC